MSTGCFIAIDGCNGSGKSNLVKNLKKIGFPASYVKEPSQSPIGKSIQDILAESGKIPPSWVQPMFLLDCIVLINDEIGPLLRAGKTVIADRWCLSSLLYGRDTGGFRDDEAHKWAIRQSVLDLIPCCSFILRPTLESLFERRPNASRSDIEEMHNAYNASGDMSEYPEWMMGKKVEFLTGDWDEMFLAETVADKIRGLECEH